jgi:hypothetical protein
MIIINLLKAEAEAAATPSRKYWNGKTTRRPPGLILLLLPERPGAADEAKPADNDKWYEICQETAERHHSNTPRYLSQKLFPLRKPQNPTLDLPFLPTYLVTSQQP